MKNIKIGDKVYSNTTSAIPSCDGNAYVINIVGDIATLSYFDTSIDLVDRRMEINISELTVKLYGDDYIAAKKLP